MDTKGEFYLGRIFDPAKGKAGDQTLLYDPADLTTHAFVVGMTGSGKTGMCVGMMEEAALNGIPALMIDPKGDITNLLLHFPDLLPQDFQPWVNPDEARRAGQTLPQAAESAATMWKKGLADWGIQPSRIMALKESAQFTVYTPGSDAGIPVSILASLKAPNIPWESNREMLREKISSTVIALLGLVGMNDIDPVRSREHILLANIFENAWSRAQDLDLGELILQTQSPPFEKLGVFDVNTFFPQKDRFELSMLLNNILAAPAFQAWIEGQPLDIPSLLFTPDGKPRHSVFYIAHLSDSERMFFITLLFSAVEAWMRTQSGTNSLRAILYFDEIFGYLPPTANPPSKQPMLRMLKQARAFGVGLVLVTQNPVDIDYKGISNTGSWFIGKLQTDRDKQRLLDGLEGVAGGMDRSAYDKQISGLAKRVFLLHNVHSKGPVQFQTRWAMNYLAGPLTRTQIPALNRLVDATLISTAAVAVEHAASPTSLPDAQRRAKPSTTPAAPVVDVRRPAAPSQQSLSQSASTGSVTRQPVPEGINEYFLPNNLTLSEALRSAGSEYQHVSGSQGLVYHPVLLAQARTQFLNRKYNLDYELPQTVIVENPDKRGVVRWENFPAISLDPQKLDDKPAPQARFTSLDTPLSDAKILNTLQRDFADWAFRGAKIIVHANEELEVYAGPDITQGKFRQMCSDAASDQHDAEVKKVSAGYETKLKALQEKIDREERELAQDKSKLSARRLDELGTAAETVFSLFSNRKSSRRITSALSKHRMASDASASVKESVQTIADLQAQIADLEKDKAQAIADADNRWGDIASKDEEITLAALKKDVNVELFGVAWFPYFLVEVGGAQREIPAFGAE
jgi:hypothetical protein